MTKRYHITEVVQDYGNRLMGFIRKRVSSAEDAEDILQDVFYQLAQADQLMKPIEQISGWLYAVARNRITDLYRKKKPDPLSHYFSDNDEDELLAELNDLLHESGATPETEYLHSLVWLELEKALQELPIAQRQAFEQSELQGLSFREMAQATGETENTLISRKRYAVKHLRKRLQIIYNEVINF